MLNVCDKLDYYIEAGRVIDYICGINVQGDDGLGLHDLLQLLTQAGKTDGGVKSLWNKMANCGPARVNALLDVFGDSTQRGADPEFVREGLRVVQEAGGLAACQATIRDARLLQKQLYQGCTLFDFEYSSKFFGSATDLVKAVRYLERHAEYTSFPILKFVQLIGTIAPSEKDLPDFWEFLLQMQECQTLQDWKDIVIELYEDNTASFLDDDEEKELWLNFAPERFLSVPLTTERLKDYRGKGKTLMQRWEVKRFLDADPQKKKKQQIRKARTNASLMASFGGGGGVENDAGAGVVMPGFEGKHKASGEQSGGEEEEAVAGVVEQDSSAAAGESQDQDSGGGADSNETGPADGPEQEPEPQPGASEEQQSNEVLDDPEVLGDPEVLRLAAEQEGKNAELWEGADLFMARAELINATSAARKQKKRARKGPSRSYPAPAAVSGFLEILKLQNIRLSDVSLLIQFLDNHASWEEMLHSLQYIRIVARLADKGLMPLDYYPKREDQLAAEDEDDKDVEEGKKTYNSTSIHRSVHDKSLLVEQEAMYQLLNAMRHYDGGFPELQKDLVEKVPVSHWHKTFALGTEIIRVTKSPATKSYSDQKFRFYLETAEELEDTFLGYTEAFRNSMKLLRACKLTGQSGVRMAMSDPLQPLFYRGSFLPGHAVRDQQTGKLLSKNEQCLRMESIAAIEADLNSMSPRSRKSEVLKRLPPEYLRKVDLVVDEEKRVIDAALYSGSEEENMEDGAVVGSKGEKIILANSSSGAAGRAALDKSKTTSSSSTSNSAGPRSQVASTGSSLFLQRVSHEKFAREVRDHWEVWLSVIHKLTKLGRGPSFFVEATENCNLAEFLFAVDALKEVQLLDGQVPDEDLMDKRSDGTGPSAPGTSPTISSPRERRKQPAAAGYTAEEAKLQEVDKETFLAQKDWDWESIYPEENNPLDPPVSARRATAAVDGEGEAALVDEGSGRAGGDQDDSASSGRLPLVTWESNGKPKHVVTAPVAVAVAKNSCSSPPRSPSPRAADTRRVTVLVENEDDAVGGRRAASPSKFQIPLDQKKNPNQVVAVSEYTGGTFQFQRVSRFSPLKSLLNQIRLYGGPETFCWLLRGVPLQRMKAQTLALQTLENSPMLAEEAERGLLVQLLEMVEELGGLRKAIEALRNEVDDMQTVANVKAFGEQNAASKLPPTSSVVTGTATGASRTVSKDGDNHAAGPGLGSVGTTTSVLAVPRVPPAPPSTLVSTLAGGSAAGGAGVERGASPPAAGRLGGAGGLVLAASPVGSASPSSPSGGYGFGSAVSAMQLGADLAPNSRKRRKQSVFFAALGERVCQELKLNTDEPNEALARAEQLIKLYKVLCGPPLPYVKPEGGNGAKSNGASAAGGGEAVSHGEKSEGHHGLGFAR
ncbi:unnamed protein product [Amoebophrya sp. A25]|nr:unnamed protein product [Amoebophrya sp. A25]|eukprot:GSA25T00003495001.1